MGAKRHGPYFCGIDAAMDVIGGKWKVLILWELAEYVAQMNRALEEQG